MIIGDLIKYFIKSDNFSVENNFLKFILNSIFKKTRSDVPVLSITLIACFASSARKI
jgi:hypothetical protein